MIIQPLFSERNAIVLICSKKYFDYAKVTIQSIVETSSKNNYDIVIISESEQPLGFDFPENISVRNFSFSEDISDFIFWEDPNISKETYFKIFVPKIFKQYNKVLYLDSDTIVSKNIDELFNIVFKQNEIIAGVEEFQYWNLLNKTVKNLPKQFKTTKDYYKEIFKLDGSQTYINAGVLLFDIQKCNYFNFTEKCLEIIKNNPLENKFLHCYDQDVINSACVNCIHYLGFEYNFIAFQVSIYALKIRYSRKKIDKDKIEEFVQTQPKIIHYASSQKPWSKPWVNYELSLFWWKNVFKIGMFDYFAERLSQNVRKKIAEMLKPSDLVEW